MRRKSEVGFDHIKAGGGEHSRDGEQKRKLHNSFAFEAEGETTHDGGASTRDAWNHSETLAESDLKGGEIRDLVLTGGSIENFDEVND